MKTRRRIVMLLLAAVLLAVGLYQESRKRNAESAAGGEQARLDRGIPAEGERGKIDPHGPATLEKLDQSLQIEAKVASTSPEGAHVAIHLVGMEAFDPVEVTAERYGPGEVVTADWSAPVWTGSLAAGTPRDLACDVPYAGSVPARIRITARATSVAGGRLSASAILRQSDLQSGGTQ